MDREKLCEGRDFLCGSALTGRRSMSGRKAEKISAFI
jgi:hypothetical protein